MESLSCEAKVTAFHPDRAGQSPEWSLTQSTFTTVYCWLYWAVKPTLTVVRSS